MVWSWLFGAGPEPLLPPIDPACQSLPVDGKEYHRISILSNDEKGSSCKTVYEALFSGKEQSDNGPCLGARTGPNKEYEWMSYQEVIDKVHQFGSGLIEAGNDRVTDKYVAIFTRNRPEFTITDFGCQAYSMVPVPLYETLGVQACKYIINECKIASVVCDNSAKAEMLLSLKSDLPSLRLLIVVEPISDEIKESSKEAGLELMTFEDILTKGKLNPKEPLPPAPEDYFSLCYTSGTTGNPKGAALTHRAFIKMVASIHKGAAPHFVANKDDVHLSYLPAAHNFERGVMVLMLTKGVRIGFGSGDIKLLTDDLATLRPTFFPTVPRLLNRIYDSVMADVKPSFIKSTLLSWALHSKQKDVDRYIYRRDTIWDKLIFHKIQDRLGGRIRMLITGSAPLSSDVMSFLRCALGCIVMEGYGQTEAGAGLSMTVPGDSSIGHVGPPLPGVELKLADVPEMNYFAKDNIGEVCAKCEFKLSEYYKQPEKTAEALDEDGWLHTGDIGTFTEQGTLKIVDRKKNVFKLSQGEYVAAEKIENVYRTSPFVGQLYVDGDSLKPCIMAIVVPDEIYLEKWAPKNGFPTKLEEFVKAEGAKELILEDILKEGKKAGLKGFEQVKDIYLEHNMFSVENELLTPTMKNKRPSLKSKYKDCFQQLYKDNGL